MATEAQKRAVAKYQAKNYEFIKLRLNKGQKEQLKTAAEKAGKSLNEYILSKITE